MCSRLDDLADRLLTAAKTLDRMTVSLLTILMQVR
jgi:hypothetical protein